MNYTNEKEQIVFLRDADIASNLEGKTISSETITANGIPSFDLFKKTYEELSTYDNNICAYIKDGVEVSVQSLCVEISNLRAETDDLSTNICTSVDYISGFVRDTISADLYELSAGTKETSTLLSNQITALWDDVRGGINYKGHMSANYTTTFPDGSQYDISTLFASYYDLLDDAAKELTADKKLNNGWLYNFTTTDLSGYRTKDGTLLENNDYLIVHNHSASCINVSEITRETVDIIEAIQSDYVRFALLEKISNALSLDYVEKIGALSDALSGDVDALSNSLCADIKTLSVQLSTDIDSLSTELSNRIDDLSTSISGVTELSVEKLQEQIISNDNDIEYLSDAISVEVKRNLDSVHYKKDIVFDPEDNTIRTTLERTFGSQDCTIRIGYMLRFPAPHKLTNESGAETHWEYEFEENDYIIFREETTPKYATEKSFDIIKDYDKEIERTYNSLCSQIFDVSTFISNDIVYLSGFVKDTISADLYALSNELCGVSTDICISANQISNALSTLSVNLSTHLCALELSVNGISDIVTTLSDNLCADIKTLSNWLSTDICADYNDLTTQISSTSSYISSEVFSNDLDIANIQNYISGDNSLCTELSNVKYHYNKTFTEQNYTKGGKDLDVDVLNVVDSEDLEKKFVLVYLSGTLVLSSI